MIDVVVDVVTKEIKYELSKEEKEEVLYSPDPSKTEILEAQVKAASEYVDFLEEVIIEMAQVVYK